MLNLLKRTSSRYSTRHILAWLWHILSRHRLQACLNTVLGCLTVALDFTFIAATKQAIDIATHKINGSLLLASILLVIILLGELLIGFFSKWIRATLGTKAQNLMQRTYFSRLLHSEWKDMNAHHSGDILNRLERDVQDISHTVTETIPSILSVSLRLVGAFFFLFSMDATLACFAILIIPLFTILSKVYMRKMRKLTREIRQTDSRIQSILQETIQHRMVVQTLEQQDTMSDKLQDVHAHLQNQVKTRTRFSATSSTVLNGGFIACYLFTFIWGVYRLESGTISYGMMIAFIQLVGQIQGPFRDFSRFIPILINAFTAGERLMELEEIPLEKDTAHKTLTGILGIRFKNVSYAYTPDSRLILEHLSFDFKPGSRTAIIGETGAGKTTLVRLMLSLIHPTNGEITIYGDNEEVQCTAGTRANFIYVPQGNTLFSGTIRDNLLLGNPQADESQMKAALQDACADFVLALPDGLDTVCNEQGNGLSEGQAQRIAIARALLRKGGILLLDEATSALDRQTEERLWQNISRHSKDKTLIFITHRTDIIGEGTDILKINKIKSTYK